MIGQTPAEILRGAAQYLTRHGWTQGRYYANLHSPSPKACALGAIGIISHGEIIAEPINRSSPDYGCLDAVAALEEYLYNHHLCDDFDVPAWNDHPARTADHVITALNNAADHWEHCCS